MNGGKMMKCVFESKLVHVGRVGKPCKRLIVWEKF